MEDNIDVDKFIALIKTKETIWNYTCSAYANKVKRKEDWIEVCEGMIPEFRNKSSEQKSAIVLQMQTKWRVIRDGFTRSLKVFNEKVEAGGRGKLYLYYDQLHFLHDLYRCKVKGKERNSGGNTNKKTNRPKRKTDESSEDDERIPMKKTHERKSTAVHNENNESGAEEDKQFLLSLLNDFKKIPEDQKLDAKGDIINVIRHYRNSSVQFETRGSYYTTDIPALSANTSDNYYKQTIIGNSPDSCSSPMESKFTT